MRMGRGKRKQKRMWPWILLGILGLLVMCSPFAQDLVSNATAHQRITQASDMYSDRDNPDRLAALAQAQAYNRKVAGEDPGMEVLPYDEQLTYGDADMMCWVDVPKAGIELPVGHGFDEATLSAGAGHIEGSSLPVGGDTAHCIITAHSGLRTARMFDDIRLLDVGDTFTLRTLGDAYTYRVVDVETISEDDIEAWDEACALQPGRDLCTLVTCTPYFVNDHRLIVTGERTYDEGADAGSPSPALLLDPRTLLALLACAGILPWLAAALMRRRPIHVKCVGMGPELALRFRVPLVARVRRGPRRWTARVPGCGIKARAKSREELAFALAEEIERTWKAGCLPTATKRQRKRKERLEERAAIE